MDEKVLLRISEEVIKINDLLNVAFLEEKTIDKNSKILLARTKLSTLVGFTLSALKEMSKDDKTQQGET